MDGASALLAAVLEVHNATLKGDVERLTAELASEWAARQADQEAARLAVDKATGARGSPPG
jgi:hypothetical protein